MTRPGRRKGYITNIEEGKRPSFAEGNPGRPEGSKNKVTLLKEKILNEVLRRRFDREKILYVKRGKQIVRIVEPEVSTTDLIKVGATFVPKELKGEGFEGKNITIVYPGLKNERSSAGDNRLHSAIKAKNLPRGKAKV